MGRAISPEQKEITGSRKGPSYLSYFKWLVGSIEIIHSSFLSFSQQRVLGVASIPGLEDTAVKKAGKILVL